jgi:hypothetical protein|nr:MAG TPA: hypothetical protein [Caudoviricetes sp.]
MKRNIALTKNGMPALWECGGAMTNSANCVIIGDKNANRKKPVFIRTGGHLSNDNHALFILNKDDIVVVGTRAHGDYTFMILKYISFEKVKGDGIGEFEVINHYSEGQWDSELEPKYSTILEAAKTKMSKYHCRETVYALGLNIVEDTLRDIKAGKMIVLDKRLSSHTDIIDTYFTVNKGREREVLKHLDLSDYSLDTVSIITKYVPWLWIKSSVPDFVREQYEKHRTTNWEYHFIIAPNTYDDDYIREMGYNGVSFEIAETRDFNELPDNKKLEKYLHRQVIYVNFINVPKEDIYSYATSDALHFILDYGNGRKLCIYDHLSYITKNTNRNPYSASSLINYDEK